MTDPGNTSAAVPDDAPRGGWQAVLSWVLLVVFCIGLLLSVVTVWARIEVLNTDVFVRTVSPLAEEPSIQNAIANRMTDLLSEQIMGDDATISALDSTPILRGLGMSFLLDFVHRTVLDFVQSPEFPAQWDTAMEFAHGTMIDALTGDREGAVTIEEGQLVLDLMPFLTSVQDRLSAAGLDAVNRIEIDPDRARIVLFESDGLAKAQRLIDNLTTLSIVLPMLTLLALAGCLVLAPGRWGMVVRAGIGATVAMVVLVVLIAIGRRLTIDALGPDANPQAATDLFEIVLRGLRKAARLTAGAGLVVAAIGWTETSAFLRRPDVVGFVRRYRGAMVAALIVVPCLGILLVDDPDLVRSIGVIVLALVAIWLVFRVSRVETGVMQSG
jgi:hypothetical protein